jgi:hypothetical protein
VAVALSWRVAPQRIHVTFAPLDLADLDLQAVQSVTPETAGAHEGATALRVRTPPPSTIPSAQSPQPALDAPAQLQRQFLEHLERQVRAHPEQWVSALTPVWVA